MQRKIKENEDLFKKQKVLWKEEKKELEEELEEVRNIGLDYENKITILISENERISNIIYKKESEIINFNKKIEIEMEKNEKFAFDLTNLLEQKCFFEERCEIIEKQSLDKEIIFLENQKKIENQMMIIEENFNQKHQNFIKKIEELTKENEEKEKKIEELIINKKKEKKLFEKYISDLKFNLLEAEAQNKLVNNKNDELIGDNTNRCKEVDNFYKSKINIIENNYKEDIKKIKSNFEHIRQNCINLETEKLKLESSLISNENLVKQFKEIDLNQKNEIEKLYNLLELRKKDYETLMKSYQNIKNNIKNKESFCSFDSINGDYLNL